ncbi:MAG: 2,3-bisphosphoglycerate-independent phosphoglycerate mutase [Thermoplasmata archaeon]
MDRLKILIVICDGVGDRPVKELGNKTPLQVAEKKNLNRLAKNGACGLLDTISPGVRPGSDTSHLALLGYDPYEVYTGRGPFEAIGVGLDVKPGDVAFRCNFATVDSNLIVKDRRAGRIKNGTKELAGKLDGMVIDGIKVIFKEGVEHRGVLVLRGEGLSSKISDPDPHVTDVPIHESSPLEKGAEKTARVLNKFVKESYSILNNHPVNKERVKNGENPANIILPRGAGVVPHIQRFEDKYKLNAVCVVGIPLVRGICRFVGMGAIEVKGATGGLDTDMLAKADAVIKALGEYDLVLMNIKAPDLCGHDGDAKGKVRIIEKIDKAIGRICDGVSDNVIIAVTGDHSTPVTAKDHTGDPLPLLISGKGVRADSVTQFDEISVASGSLHRLRGKDLMPVLMDLAGVSEKFGA